jgi:LysR family nod box-dependent transcriptional activator
MRFERLDLNLLVALDALLELRSVTAAAERVGVTQTGMTAALNRLREYFQDDLFVVSGRQMCPTALAEQLYQPVRDALTLIGSTVTSQASFDPNSSTRSFTILLSDYTYTVLMAKVVNLAAVEAPDVTFTFGPAGPASVKRLARADADLLLTTNLNRAKGMPSIELLSDRYVVVCWSENPLYGDSITVEEFIAGRHVAVTFDAESQLKYPLIDIERNVVISVPDFYLVAPTLVGSRFLATLYYRQALLLAKIFPLRIMPLPVDLPKTTVLAQWHSVRNNDRALLWLLEHIKRVAATLPAL